VVFFKLCADILPNMVVSTPKIYISNSRIKGAGRGVFAGHLIAKGELIEKCPFIELSQGDPAVVWGSALVSYFFFFGKEKEKVALVLGYGSLYNHSDTPNATYTFETKKNIVVFRALKKIKKGEEITFSYRGNKKSKKSLWFEV
jgi:SET domain-containing protein